MAEEETKNKKNLIQWFKEHPKTTFWIRFVLWVLFSCVGPVAFIVYRFDLFSPNAASFGGWGLIAIIIIMVFVISLLNYIRKGLAEYSFIGQCIKGFTKVIIPLCTVLFVTYSIRNSLDAFIQALSFTIMFEAIAIPINPLPSWISKNLTESQQKQLNDATDVLWDKFFSRKKEDTK